MNLVSIIIPCYNYGWLLPETLDSVLTQTYPHWECIIIDDGSTDNSRAVGEEYQARDTRFRYIYQENKGMSAARNTGVAAAKGQYIQFLDSDDLLVPRKLETQVLLLEAHPEVDIVYGDVRCFRQGQPDSLSRSFDMQDSAWMPEVSGCGAVMINALVKKNIMAVNAALIRRELLQRVGPVAEHLRSVEDWEYWVRCALAGACFLYDGNPAAWALVRVHPTSTSHNMLRMYEHEVLVRNELATKLQQLGATEALHDNEMAIVNGASRIAMHDLMNGNSLDGIKRLIQLAFRTGRYAYYLKSIPYGFKMRLKSGSKTG
ncbi:glycosyltransferase [Hymenobacter sp. BT186]|uniref:Glycosyltransferase n=1 Tax=Hymenobacter telluris TaxID=2816474 RepID=A0A939JBK0_9BACT|nr:glycosyltransferase [Hymenobacter telluris]MBO0357370.1 glycosyltransferase [Hymenobacter telluris]MBW3373396.1 glycosyltransferase [Hymenobacter norwichensis]